MSLTAITVCLWVSLFCYIQCTKKNHLSCKVRKFLSEGEDMV